MRISDWSSDGALPIWIIGIERFERRDRRAPIRSDAEPHRADADRQAMPHGRLRRHHRHPGLVPGSTPPRTPTPAARWTPEQVRGDGGGENPSPPTHTTRRHQFLPPPHHRLPPPPPPP